ncbi:MAG: hypothetical protein FWE11_08675 [Defluviitaleaceae bacterium]|nr:hypothetical protein [Defluviitaleaceae bacterium]
MDKLSPAVMDAFRIYNRGIKKEKGHYLCTAEDGPIKVHITYESIEAIRMQHVIKEQLAESGFPWTDRYKLTRAAKPYIIIGRETYVATDYPGASETDFENEAQVLQAVRSLAFFHNAAKGVKGIAASSPLPDIFIRQIFELSQAGKQARKGSRMSDFDVLFIKHAPKAREIMEDAVARLAKTDYAGHYTNAIQKGRLCHNLLKEENLLAGDESTYIINFSGATIDLQINDLAALIRRYALRSSRLIPVSRLIEEYAAIHPLPQDSTDILYAQLIFPWSFMKLTTQYYSKKRNWTPNGLINRMETLLAELESYEKYILFQ